MLKTRAGFGNQLLHGLSNDQAEFGNEVVDSEINGYQLICLSEATAGLHHLLDHRGPVEHHG